MSKVELDTLPTFKITLSNKEATWLLNFIQNYPGNREDEPTNDARYREELFNELHAWLT